MSVPRRRCRPQPQRRVPPSSSRSGTSRFCSSLLILVFSLLKGDTFLTAFTFQSMVNSRSINAMVALAVMIPLASNNFDLSVASILGITQVLANGLQTQQGLPWQVVFVLCILLGALRRADQRPPGHAREDQLLHRHARHRHAAARPQPVVHRRHAGGRPAAARLRRLVRQDPLHRHSGAGRLRADHRAGPVGRLRLPAARPLSSTSSATARARPSSPASRSPPTSRSRS